jgi:hypothetical protein
MIDFKRKTNIFQQLLYKMNKIINEYNKSYLNFDMKTASEYSVYFDQIVDIACHGRFLIWCVLVRASSW